MEPAERVERFRIRGMRGAETAAAVENAAAQASGVSAAHADSDEATLMILAGVDYSASEVQALVAAAGYRAIPAAEVIGPGDSILDREDPRANLSMIVACGIAAVLVLFLQRQGRGEPVELAILAIVTAAIAIAGAAFFRGAAMAERNHAANMDTLVALGIGAAYLYSIVAAFPGAFSAVPKAFLHGPPLFDATIALILFIRFGKFVESRARRHAITRLRAPLESAPAKAAVIRDGKETVVPVSELAYDEIVAVAAGAKIPADGTVMEGAGTAYESILTGDSAPAEKRTGSRVFCGTLNGSAPLKIRTEATGSDTAAARIVRISEAGQAGNALLEKRAETLATRAVRTAIVAAALAFAAWLWFGGGFPLALSAAIAVLVTAAPAAMGQAAPTALMAGSAIGLRRGILFKRAPALEGIARANVMIFAKAGTLTQGRPELETLVALEGGAREALALAAIAAAGSDHPLSKAVTEGARTQGVAPAAVASGGREFAGMGVAASHGAGKIALGNEHMMTRHGVPNEPHARAEFDQIAQSGATPAYLAADRKILAILGFRDPVRPEARGAIAALRDRGVSVVLASGDSALVANDLARRLGIDEVHAQLLPAGKIGVVKHFQAAGNVVCMVGDGTLDAPALAAADISIAIGAGPDTTAEAGDIVLARGDLYDVVRAVTLGNLTVAKIRQNLFWAGLYNIIAIPIAAGILYPMARVALNPAVGGLAMGLAGAGIAYNSRLLNLSAWFRLRAIRPVLEAPEPLENEEPAPRETSAPPDAAVVAATDSPASAKSKSE
ncbi:MAG: heavy metal translocating P-type ATPase [Candidatus Binataceae bacterium]